MSALTQKAPRPSGSEAARRVPWIPLFPTLWPSMLRPATNRVLPFPLNDRNRRDFMSARYGIYALARALDLHNRELLFPAFFHCVELEAVLAAGAHVRFYGVDTNLGIDFEDLAARILPSTAAVYVIHYAGFPAAIRQLRELCRDRGLILIEDCAHALLSTDHGQPLGSFGDAAAFSLPKSLPTPDGGVALLQRGWPEAEDRRATASRAWLAAHSMSLVLSNLEMRKAPASGRLRAISRRAGRSAFTVSGSDYVPMGTPDFDLTQSNRSMSALTRRILKTQSYATVIERRRDNYLALCRQLDGVVEPIFPTLMDGVCPLFFPFRVADRDAVMAGLRAQGLTVGEFWPDHHPQSPMNEFPVLRDLHRALWLPCHQDLSPELLSWLISATTRAVQGSR